MRSVGIDKLRNELNDYIRLAECGETVLVTERDRVVARLVPPQQPTEPASDREFLARGVREGWLKPATTKGVPLPPSNPVMNLEELLHELDEDREDR